MVKSDSNLSKKHKMISFILVLHGQMNPKLV
jgi:hypothetical protein